MKYFLHDTNAFADEKVTLLYMEFGYEGVGLFFTILERLARQEKPVAEEVLKTQLYIGKRLQKQLNFMYKIDILSLRNGDVFSETLLNFSEKYQIKKEKTRKKVAEWRAKQDTVTSYTSVTEGLRNHLKVKKSKVKEENIKEVTEKFESFWSLYPKRKGKKVGKQVALNMFNKLNLQNGEYETLMRAVRNYSDEEYPKDAERFLKNEYWRDWITTDDSEVTDSVKAHNDEIKRRAGL